MLQKIRYQSKLAGKLNPSSTDSKVSKTENRAPSTAFQVSKTKNRAPMCEINKTKSSIPIEVIDLTKSDDDNEENPIPRAGSENPPVSVKSKVKTKLSSLVSGIKKKAQRIVNPWHLVGHHPSQQKSGLVAKSQQAPRPPSTNLPPKPRPGPPANSLPLINLPAHRPGPPANPLPLINLPAHRPGPPANPLPLINLPAHRLGPPANKLPPQSLTNPPNTGWPPSSHPSYAHYPSGYSHNVYNYSTAQNLRYNAPYPYHNY